MNDLYQQEILQAAKEKQNFGSLPDTDVQSEHYNAACGDKIMVQLKFSPDQKTITDLKWQGEGCIISQAAMSRLSQAAIGQKIKAVQQLTKKDLLNLLHLENISPGREHCLQIGLEAIKKALKVAKVAKIAKAKLS